MLLGYVSLRIYCQIIVFYSYIFSEGYTTNVML